MRIDFDTYFMKIASIVALRSGCLRRQVGAVIVSPDKRILATGYNASPIGIPECFNKGTCLRENYDSGEGLYQCMAIHAEENAILQCSKYGVSCEGCSIYITTFPCANCIKSIINSGIKEVIYQEQYNSPLTNYLAEESGIQLRLFKEEL